MGSRASEVPREPVPVQESRPDARHALATAVIGAEAVFGLFGGYAAWDGTDPDTPEEVAEGVERPGRGEDRFNIVRGFAEAEVSA